MYSGYLKELEKNPNIEKAAIIDNMCDATISDGWNITQYEIGKLVSHFDTNFSDIRTYGVTLAGIHYFTLKAEIASRGMADGLKVVVAQKGHTGVSLAFSYSFIAIGMWGEGMNPGEVHLAVETMARYFIDSGR